VVGINPSYGFSVPVTGTYYIRIAGYQPATMAAKGIGMVSTKGAYTLELHRLALAQGQQEMATLQTTGAMYAWLTGNTLNITGPTGYGFGIKSNWAETTTTSGKLICATYKTTGDVDLIFGNSELHLGSGFTLTTKPQVKPEPRWSSLLPKIR